MGVESLNCPDRSWCVASLPGHFQRGGTGQGNSLFMVSAMNTSPRERRKEKRF